jgi:hypothetical protein
MIGQLADELSFRQVVSIPFDACLAALDRWQLTGPDRELRLGDSLLLGPAERDHRSGTWRIAVRMARGPLRRPIRMRLDIDYWSDTRTALELVPGRWVRPSAAYFAAGHRLLDSVIRALRTPGPARRYWSSSPYGTSWRCSSTSSSGSSSGISVGVDGCSRSSAS